MPIAVPAGTLTFSAPKSVSVLWSQASEEVGREVRAAHAEAVEKALAYVEEQCGWTRRGKAGAEKERASLFFATFEHGTSRAQDPQLHTHALLLNACLRSDGTTGALDTMELYYHKMAAGALYRAELSRQLELRLGLESLRTGSTFELAGVPEELIDEFSTRRKEIEKALRELGLDGPEASANLALRTRTHKEHRSRDSLFRQWRETGLRFGWSTEQVNSLIREGYERPEAELEVAAQLASMTAVDRITEGYATFTERDVVRFAAEEAQGGGIGADRTLRAARETLEKSAHIVRLGKIDDEIRYTTKEILDIERDLMRRVQRSQLAEAPRVAPKRAERAIGRRKTIKAEQADAVRHITTGSGSIAVVTGDAGTGKTYMLDAVREAYEKGGYQVIGAALAGKAAQGLQEGADIESSTLHSLFWKIDASSKGVRSPTGRGRLQSVGRIEMARQDRFRSVPPRVRRGTGPPSAFIRCGPRIRSTQRQFSSSTRPAWSGRARWPSSSSTSKTPERNSCW
jgi:conjugative relaxase-like TrwC/TraI family protein